MKGLLTMVWPVKVVPLSNTELTMLNIPNESLASSQNEI